jgi:hypothetical protein
MVVISASICNKNGKILMARQFIPITRIKLEEYVANFPKLIESGKTLSFVSNTLIQQESSAPTLRQRASGMYIFPLRSST